MCVCINIYSCTHTPIYNTLTCIINFGYTVNGNGYIHANKSVLTVYVCRREKESENITPVCDHINISVFTVGFPCIMRQGPVCEHLLQPCSTNRVCVTAEER